MNALSSLCIFRSDPLVLNVTFFLWASVTPTTTSKITAFSSFEAQIFILPSILFLSFDMVVMFFSSVVGHSGYKVSEEIAFVVKDVGADLFDGMRCFYLFRVSKADKHPC